MVACPDDMPGGCAQKVRGFFHRTCFPRGPVLSAAEKLSASASAYRIVEEGVLRNQLGNRRLADMH